MQPFVNPQFFGSPSYQQYMQTPIYQQVAQPIASTIRGKIINSVDEIMVNDVPMDGSRAVFMKSDGSEIYTRGWRPDGTIDSRRYTPQEAPVMQNINNMSANDSNGLYEAINAKLDHIEKRLEAMNEYKHNADNANGKHKSNAGTSMETNGTK